MPRRRPPGEGFPVQGEDASRGESMGSSGEDMAQQRDTALSRDFEGEAFAGESLSDEERSTMREISPIIDRMDGVVFESGDAGAREQFTNVLLSGGVVTERLFSVPDIKKRWKRSKRTGVSTRRRGVKGEPVLTARAHAEAMLRSGDLNFTREHGYDVFLSTARGGFLKGTDRLLQPFTPVEQRRIIQGTRDLRPHWQEIGSDFWAGEDEPIDLRELRS